MYPLKLFISHKISTHGKGAEEFARILRNVSDRDKLEIFVSPEMQPGEPWSQRVHEHLQGADILVVLYLVENVQMGWCDYEAGYFLGVSEMARDLKRRIISVINCDKPPEFLASHQCVQADDQGIERLLRAILKDKAKPVKPQLFDSANIDDLRSIKSRVLKVLNPSRRQSISPRLWITIDEQQLERIKAGQTPPGLRLEGESEALHEFGIGPQGGITYSDFYKQSKYKNVLDLYIPHLVEAVRKIVENGMEFIPIPPVRITKSPHAKTLVPAYIERNFDKSLRIEFFVYQPRASFQVESQSPPNALFNLIVIAWRFRWMIIEDFLERLLNKRDRVLAGVEIEKEGLRADLKELGMKINLVLLDSFNRGIQYPRKFERLIKNERERAVLKRINDPRDGIWVRLNQKLQEGIAKEDIDQVIEVLKQMHLSNKDYLNIITNAFQDFVKRLDDRVYE